MRIAVPVVVLAAIVLLPTASAAQDRPRLGEFRSLKRAGLVSEDVQATEPVAEQSARARLIRRDGSIDTDLLCQMFRSNADTALWNVRNSDGELRRFAASQGSTYGTELVLGVLAVQSVVDALLRDVRTTDPGFACFGPAAP